MAPLASCAVQRAYVHLPRFPWSPHMYLRCARSLRRVCVSHVGAVFGVRFQRCSRRVRVQHQRKSGVRWGRVTLLTLLTRAFFFRDGLFCGGLCMSFIRRAYLHTTSSVLVHRATVSVGLAICGHACAACVSEWCAWFPWISSVVCVVCVVRFPTIARACHAACDAHLVPTLRALHHRVPRSYKRAHVPGRVGAVCCVPRNTRFPRADFFLLMKGMYHIKKNGYFTLYPPPETCLAPASVARSFSLILYFAMSKRAGARQSRDRISQNTLHIRLFHTIPPTPSSENSAVMQRHHSI
jgi:hypothetical protein